MKKIYLLNLFICFSFLLKAQILKIATTPTTISSQIPSYSQVTTINTKTFNYTPTSISVSPPISTDGDSLTEVTKMYDFGDVIPVNISMIEGNITSTTNGKVWTLRVSIPNALNIGLTFNQFNLSPNAEMYIFNESRTILDSAIKKEHFVNSSKVNISSLKGNSIIIYIIELNNFNNLQSSINIQDFVAGYQDVKDVGETFGNQLRASVNCNPLIQCQQSKIPYARAVARLTVRRSSTTVASCTGTLINNEANNGRPFFVTAFHCIDANKNKVLEQSEINALLLSNFQFQFWATNCYGTTISSGIEFSGAILRAASYNSDFVLLELLNPPGIGDLVNYAGYNRSTNPPADYNGFIIHHPQSVDMRITTVENTKSWFWNGDFWSSHYSSGTVDMGSSGSALMNGNGQIVGQLRGGWSSCDFTDFGDRYGKFDKSWNYANLQQFLSPNQSSTALNLLDLTEIKINGTTNIIACTTPATFSTLPNLLGVTYEWTVTSELQIVSGQGTSAIRISGFASNNAGSGFLTLTLRSPAKGRTRIYSVTKQIFISNGGLLGYYNSPTNSAQPLAPLTRRNQAVNYCCLAVATNMQFPAGSLVTWDGPANTSNIIWGRTNDNNVYIYFTDVNQSIVLSLNVINSCGERGFNYNFTCNSATSCGVSPAKVSLAPNPTISSMQVNLVNKANESIKRDVTEIRIIDKLGNIKQQIKYPIGTKNISLNTSLLNSDVYTILVFDGEVWTPEKFIKN